MRIFIYICISPFISKQTFSSAKRNLNRQLPSFSFASSLFDLFCFYIVFTVSFAYFVLHTCTLYTCAAVVFWRKVDQYCLFGIVCIASNSYALYKCLLTNFAADKAWLLQRIFTASCFISFVYRTIFCNGDLRDVGLQLINLLLFYIRKIKIWIYKYVITVSIFYKVH